MFNLLVAMLLLLFLFRPMLRVLSREDLDMLNLTDVSSSGLPSEPDAFLSALNALCEEDDASSDAATFTNSLNSVYAEAIHWRKKSL